VPPHVLDLAVGTVMLLRNLNPNKGLSNGTRLLIKALHDNVIDCEVLTGKSCGERIFLPRYNF
jgi:ATP-dependent DNA helicase PIF1